MCPPLDSAPSGGTDLLEQVEQDTRPDTPWSVLLHNDPVNTTDYVTTTLMVVLQVDQGEAERLMMAAHLEGKAAVFAGKLSECEPVAVRLSAHQLWTSLEKTGA